MKANTNRTRSQVLLLRRGVTLIELTVIMLVLLMLLGFLFPTANAWKKGANRSNCIISIRQVQMGVRSFSNMMGLDSGINVSTLSPPLVLQNEIIGTDKFVETAPACPGLGSYEYGGNVIPVIGTL